MRGLLWIVMGCVLTGVAVGGEVEGAREAQAQPCAKVAPVKCPGVEIRDSARARAGGEGKARGKARVCGIEREGRCPVLPENLRKHADELDAQADEMARAGRQPKGRVEMLRRRAKNLRLRAEEIEAETSK